MLGHNSLANAALIKSVAVIGSRAKSGNDSLGVKIRPAGKIPAGNLLTQTIITARYCQWPIICVEIHLRAICSVGMGDKFCGQSPTLNRLSDVLNRIV